MYDLNLSVPNITANKYSTDSRFLLLKNYLYELNETLSYALIDKSKAEIEEVKKSIETEKNQEKENIIRLNNESKKRFEELKEKIIRTAEAIEMEYSAAISKSEENILSQVETTLSESLTNINEDLSSVGSEVRELASSLDIYIRTGELEEGVYGVEIGRIDSNIKARFTGNRLSFFHGLSEVAYISGGNIYIKRAEILDFLKIGNQTDGYFTFNASENGLEVIWSDGS